MNGFVQTRGVPIDTRQQHFKEFYDAEESRNVNECETGISAAVIEEEVEAKYNVTKSCVYL